ncbi:MAG: helix-turn-helix domain-containing protein [Candidatus Gastranaerophilales bacterium]
MTKKNPRLGSTLEEAFCEIVDSKEDVKNYLDMAFNEYLEDSDFDAFFESLRLCILAQDNIEGFAKKVNLSKMGLYNIVNGKKEPKITTLSRILKELGYSLKIA